MTENNPKLTDEMWERIRMDLKEYLNHKFKTAQKSKSDTRRRYSWAFGAAVKRCDSLPLPEFKEWYLRSFPKGHNRSIRSREEPIQP